MIVAGLASLPERADSLRRVVDSLLPQVDRVGVYLNGYDEVPAFLEHERISVATSRLYGDRGDAGKFWLADALPPDSYYLSCDDDLVYPSDYVATMVAAVDRLDRRAVVTLGGKVLASDGRILVRHHALVALARETRVHLPLSGVAAYHSSAFSPALSAEDFPIPNMADVWMGIVALDRSAPVVAIPHRGRWLGYLPPPRTIWDETIRRSGSAMDTADAQESARASRVWPALG